MLYDLRDRSLLGGVAIEAENSSQIDKSKFSRNPDYLREDLIRNARYRLDEAMKPLLAK